MFCVKIKFLAYFALVRLILYVFRNIFCLSEAVDTDAHAGNHLTMPQHVVLHEAGLRQSPRLESKRLRNLSRKHMSPGLPKPPGQSPCSLCSHSLQMPSLTCLRTTFPPLLLMLSVPFVVFMRWMNSMTIHCIVSVHMLLALLLWTCPTTMSFPIPKQCNNRMLCNLSKKWTRKSMTISVGVTGILFNKAQSPPGTKTIQAIWSFKRKCYSDGTLNKHKAWLCAHSSMQQWGVSYWETYSPVVNMLTVRLLLALCDMHGF